MKYVNLMLHCVFRETIEFSHSLIKAVQSNYYPTEIYTFFTHLKETGNNKNKYLLYQIIRLKYRGVATGVCGGCHTPKKILKTGKIPGKLMENSGKIRGNSVTSDNICGC